MKGISPDGKWLFAGFSYGTVCIEINGSRLSCKSFCKQQNFLGIYDSHVVFVNKYSGKTAQIVFYLVYNLNKPDFVLNMDVLDGIVAINMKERTILLKSDYSPSKSGNIFKVDYKGNIIEKYPLPKYLMNSFNRFICYKNYLLTFCKISLPWSALEFYTAVINFKPGNNALDIPVCEVIPARIANTGKNIVQELRQNGGVKRTVVKIADQQTSSDFCWSKDYKHFFMLTNKGILKKISSSSFQTVACIDFKEPACALQQSAQGLLVVMPKFSQLAIVDENNLLVKNRLFIPDIDKLICARDSKVAFSYENSNGTLKIIDLENGKINGHANLKEVIKKHKTSVSGTPHIAITSDGKQFFYNTGCNVLKFKITDDGLVLDGMSKKIEDGTVSSFGISNDGKFIVFSTPWNGKISIYDNGTLEHDEIKPGAYIVNADNFDSPAKRLLPYIICPVAIDIKLGAIYALGGVYDINSGMTIIHDSVASKILLVPGEKEYLSIKPMQLTYVRWGLEAPKPVPETVRGNVFGKERTEQGVTAIPLNIKGGDKLINNCCWEPGTDNIFIASRNGKVSKINLEKGIEICSLDLGGNIENITLSKKGLLVNAPSIKKVSLLSSDDLSVKGEIQLECEQILSHPTFNVVFLHYKDFIMTYDLIQKKVVDITLSGNIESAGFYRLSPAGKVLYAKGDGQFRIFSIINERLNLISNIPWGQLLRATEKLVISNDGRYWTALPQQHPNVSVQKKYAVVIFRQNSPEKRVGSINTGSMINALGIDSVAGLIYTYVRRNNGDRLIIKQNNKMHEYDLLGNNKFMRRIYVHPEGGKFIMQTNAGLIFVKVDFLLKKDEKGRK